MFLPKSILSMHCNYTRILGVIPQCPILARRCTTKSDIGVGSEVFVSFDASVRFLLEVDTTKILARGCTIKSDIGVGSAGGGGGGM